MSDFVEKFFHGVVVLMVVVLVVTLGAVVLDATTGKSCYESTKDLGVGVDWSFWEGCRVEVESGRWIPLDNWYYAEHQ